MQTVWGSGLNARCELMWQNKCTHPPVRFSQESSRSLFPITCTRAFLVPSSQPVSLRILPGNPEEKCPVVPRSREWMVHALGSWGALRKFISCTSMSSLRCMATGICLCACCGQDLWWLQFLFQQESCSYPTQQTNGCSLPGSDFLRQKKRTCQGKLISSVALQMRKDRV